MTTLSTSQHTAASVRAEIARAGRTARSVALALGWSTSTMSRRLSGETEFTVSELATLATLLGVPITDLLPREPVEAVSA
jgi:transcriptional regulator with XRE-family HTH domain